MTKYEFVKRFLPEAEAAEKRFHLNPVVMLAQAAIESGWNESNLAKLHRNLFGITGYGPSNEFWHGCRVELVPRGLDRNRQTVEQMTVSGPVITVYFADIFAVRNFMRKSRRIINDRSFP